MANDITTLEEAETVHGAAAEAMQRADYDTAYGLLHGVYESGEATGELGARVRYALGEVFFQRDDYDTAERFYNEAYEADPKGQIGFDASVRLARLKQRDDAQNRAANDAVSGDVKGTCEAAWNLLVAKNYDAAIELYLLIYDDPVLEQPVRAAVALDLGRCYIGLADYVTARQWLQWATFHGGNLDEIGVEVAHLDQLESAQAAASDGTGADEMVAVHLAADAAYKRGDAATAVELWSTILQNPGTPPDLRSTTVVNLGQCYVKLGDYDTARSYFSEAVGSPDPRAVAAAHERLDMLNRLDHSIQEAGLLPPE